MNYRTDNTKFDLPSYQVKFHLSMAGSLTLKNLVAATAALSSCAIVKVNFESGIGFPRASEPLTGAWTSSLISKYLVRDQHDWPGSNRTRFNVLSSQEVSLIRRKDASYATSARQLGKSIVLLGTHLV